MQYVGKNTQPFKKRHSGHKQEVKKERGGLGHHYGHGGTGLCGTPVPVSVPGLSLVSSRSRQRDWTKHGPGLADGT